MNKNYEGYSQRQLRELLADLREQRKSLNRKLRHLYAEDKYHKDVVDAVTERTNKELDFIYAEMVKIQSKLNIW